MDSPIVEALAQEVTCDFQETPLGEAVKFLEAELGIEIELDRRALDEVGLAASSPVSLTIRDIGGEAALHHLLHSIDWAPTFTVEDDVLKITTRVAAEENLQTVAYAVGDLTVPLDLDEVIAIDKHFKGFNEDRQLDRLIDVINQTIEPDSWSDVGGPGEAVAHGMALIVSQTWEIQRKIDRLLAALRAVRDGQTIQPLPDARTAAIEKALDTKIKVDFADAPLRDVAANLNERTGTQILLQQSALNAIGISGDVAVTIHLKDVSLRSVLRLILADIDPVLVYDVRHEALMITSREASEEDLQVAAYPVGHLVKGAAEQATNRADYDALIDNICTAIEPDSWDHVGGPGSIIAFSPCQCLVVSQTYEIHRRVKQLLAKLPRASNAMANEAPPAAPQAAPPSDPYRTAIYHLRRPKPSGTAETPPAEGEEAVAATPPEEASPDNDTAKEDHIAQVVKSSVDPASWRNDEASIESLPGKLVIRQRESMHNKILKLLESLELLGDRYGSRGFGGFGDGFDGGFGDFDDSQEFGGGSKGLDFFFKVPAPEEDSESSKPPTSNEPAGDLDDDPFGGDPFGGDPFGGDPVSTDEPDPPDDQQPTAEQRPLDNPEAISLPIRDWFARANQFFRLLDVKEKQSARLILAMQYASRGKLDRVKRITLQIANPRKRKECVVLSTVSFLFSTGNAKRAIELANGLDHPADRDAALRTIAAKLADFHRFNQAVKTAKMIDDRQEANYAWQAVARDQARAGMFAAARRSIDAMTILTDEDRDRRDDIREIIKQRRASGEIDEPQIPGETARDRNDRKLQTLKAISVDEIAEIEAGLNEIDTEFEHAQTLRALGVAHFFKGDLDRANEFADDALAKARTIEDRLQRVLLFAYIADLMVQLERKEEARALAIEAYTIGREKAPKTEADATDDATEAEAIVKDVFFNMFADMARAPMLAAVLLETGDADTAFAFAQEHADKTGTNMMLWSTIGKWHAEKDRLDELVQRLESVESAEAKFYLCTGVIDCLIDLERRLKSDAAPS